MDIPWFCNLVFVISYGNYQINYANYIVWKKHKIIKA